MMTDAINLNIFILVCMTLTWVNVTEVGESKHSWGNGLSKFSMDLGEIWCGVNTRWCGEPHTCLNQPILKGESQTWVISLDRERIGGPKKNLLDVGLHPDIYIQIPFQCGMTTSSTELFSFIPV